MDHDKKTTIASRRAGTTDASAAPGRTSVTQTLSPVQRAPAATRAGSPADLIGEHTGRAHGLVPFAGDVHAAAAHGTRAAGGTLPFLDQIQSAFGHHDVGGIVAHVGGAAREASDAMGASAYATGDHVAFGDAPDLHLAAHEAAHVVQQRAGVALFGGVGAAGDRYEQHADEVADAVVRGESAEHILDPLAGKGGGAAVQQRAVQRNDRRRQAALGNTPRRDDPHEIRVQYSTNAETFITRLAAALGRWVVYRSDHGATAQDLVRNNSNAVTLWRELEGTADGATISLTAHLIRRDEPGPNHDEVIDIRFHRASRDRPRPQQPAPNNQGGGDRPTDGPLGRPRTPQQSLDVGGAGQGEDTASGVAGIVGSATDVIGLGAEVAGASTVAMTAGLAGLVTTIVAYGFSIASAHAQDQSNARIAGLRFAVEGLGALSEQPTYDRDTVRRDQLQRGAPTSYSGYQQLQLSCHELPDHAIQAEMIAAGDRLAREISNDLRRRVAELRTAHPDQVGQLPQLRAAYLRRLYEMLAPRVLATQTPQAQGLQERIERDRPRQGPGPERF